MQNPACVTVQVVSVALIVNVSALKRSCLDYMSFAQGILDWHGNMLEDNPIEITCCTFFHLQCYQCISSFSVFLYTYKVG